MLADVRDEARMRRLMEEIRPELVFHAAALKHVPMVENDPLEGLLTNAHGTRIVADTARAAGCGDGLHLDRQGGEPDQRNGRLQAPGRDVLPGASIARRGPCNQGMRCITVRFGNVLGSTGSVVPLFRRQLERGGPLTVTHPDMRRYFMTVREAVGLVLQAAVVGAPDRDDAPPELREGGIFVLDMGSPVKIVDLARRMIRLAGLRPRRMWKSASPACAPGRSSSRKCSTAGSAAAHAIRRPARRNSAHRRCGIGRPRAG
jgi:FlaA1/EpsC-like NDP-sugar epimerase